MEIITSGPDETLQVGKKIGRNLLKETLDQRKNAFVFSLEGELGTGKTIFTKGLGAGLGIEAIIKSPTFVITRQYQLKKSAFFSTFIHMDCYRLESGEDLKRVGFDDFKDRGDFIIVVEWGDRVKSVLPEARTTVKFKTIDKEKRKLIFSGPETKKISDFFNNGKR